MGAVIDSHCDGLQRLQESGNLSYIAVLAPGYGKKGLVTCGVLGLGALAGGSALVYLAAFGYIASTGPLGLVFMGVAIVLGVIALALFVGAMRYFKAPFSGDRWGRNAESAEKEVIAAASSYKLHVERGTKEKETWGDLWHRKVHCIKAAWASIHITASIGECFGKTWRKLGTEWTTSFHGLRTIGQSKTEGNPKPTCALVLRRRHAAVAASGGAHAGVVGEHMLHLPPPSSRCGSPDSYLDCEEAA
jgi:hypothetical protein